MRCSTLKVEEQDKSGVTVGVINRVAWRIGSECL